MYRVRRGLGMTASDIATCQPAAQTFFGYAFHPQCWGYSVNDWNTMAAFPTPPAPAPPGVPGTTGDATADINTALASGVEQTQQNYSDFFQSVPEVPGGAAPSISGGLSMTTLIALGVGAGIVLLLVSSGRRR